MWYDFISFFKDHLQTYKKRPIYWLFSSGKQHRYNQGTLSRMRSEYAKEQAKLAKQQVALPAFDEKLRHYADRRITLDLDDGVKVNYGKFGDLLAEVVAVRCQKPESV